MEKFGKFELTLGQCFELYNLLGGDEKEAYKDIVIQNEDDKDNANINPKDDINQKIVKRKKKIKY